MLAQENKNILNVDFLRKSVPALNTPLINAGSEKRILSLKSNLLKKNDDVSEVQKIPH